MTEKRTRIGPVVIIGVVCFVIAGAYAIYLFLALKPSQVRSPVKTGPATAVTIRIGTFSTAIDYAPALVAKSKGWLNDELGPDASMEWTTFQTLPTINEAFAAGKLDVVFEAEVPAIVGRAAGIDIRIVNVGATLREETIVPINSPVTAVPMLAGKRIAVLAGTAMHFGLLESLRQAGVPAQAVSIINMIPPDAAAAFSSGQVDAWAVWPPWPQQQVVNGRARFLPGTEATIQSVVVMRGEFIQSQRSLATRINTVVEKSKMWLQANPDEGISVIATELKLPIEVVKLAWPKHDWKASITPDFINDIQKKSEFLLNEKMIQKAVSATELVSPLK